MELTTKDPTILRNAEQKWLDTIKNEYNILKIARSSQGYVHTKEGRENISKQIQGKLRNAEVRKAMSRRQTGSNNTFFGKTHTQHATELIRQSALNRSVLHKPGYKVT